MKLSLESQLAFARALSGTIQIDLLNYKGSEAQMFCASRLTHELMRKLKVPSQSAEDASWDLFQRMQLHNCDHSAPRSFDWLTELVLNEASYSIWKSLHGDHNVCFENVADHMNLGGGANVGAIGTTFIGKTFLSDLTATSLNVARIFGCAIKRSTWQLAENLRLKAQKTVIVGGSQLTFVPKTVDICRTVCTEPTINMLLQRGVSWSFERALALGGTDLTRQESVNKCLAQRGSLDGSLATIDLRSASDCITRSLVVRLFPAEVVRWLDLTRSPATRYRGKYHNLDIYCTMGNGWTFSLQTLIFKHISLACMRLLEHKPVLNAGKSGQPPKEVNCGFFGDDIIVPSSCFTFVCKMLSNLGFIVNDKKSFGHGPFRESCGGDYYHGIDVRPLYIKNLRDDNDIKSAFNRLAIWSANHGFFPHETLTYLWNRIRRKNLIPCDENIDGGIYYRKPPRLLVRAEESGGYWVSYHVFRPKSYLLDAERYPALFVYMALLRGDVGTPDYVLSSCGKVPGLKAPDLHMPRSDDKEKVERLVRSPIWRSYPLELQTNRRAAWECILDYYVTR